ncbi:hypothetical protein FA95DRAFT_1611994 [Auriscalpium vulgare]|uniref:Uncharacterized protein n=1 Tax=Auriscalpium vulgare TaxID=40419 RepID=A0ACB8R8G9_9AGAM|nr:hypothetical protein FA95DRAFT_1611994 [Auriscalpium vulgare]
MAHPVNLPIVNLNMAHQVTVPVIFAAPGLYVLQVHIPSFWWPGSHQVPCSFATTSASPLFAPAPAFDNNIPAPAFPSTASAPAPALTHGFAFPSHDTAPTPAHAPAFRVASEAPAFPTVHHTPTVESAPAGALLFHIPPPVAAATNPAPTVVTGTPELAAPKPRAFSAAPAFLDALAPSALAPSALAPSAPSFAAPDSPIFFAGGSPVVFAAVPPASIPRTPSPREIPFTPLTPAPRVRRPQRSPSPPPMPSQTPEYCLPPMSPFGGARVLGPDVADGSDEFAP